MFWSKIWFFLVAVLAAVGLTIALVMPRPAERATRANERARLQRACGVARILLEDNARKRVQLAGDIARSTLPGASKTGLGQVLLDAGKGDTVPPDAHAKAKEALLKLRFGGDAAGDKSDKGDKGGKSDKASKGSAPDFIVLVDRKGRVVARTGAQSNDYSDSMRGFYLVDDALDGYLRDDLWLVGRTLYAVAGSPVVTNTYPFEWAGAVVTGREISNDFAADLERSLDVKVAFYAGEEAVASSTSAAIHEDVIKHFGGLDPKTSADCSGEPFSVTAGAEVYDVVLARLPGEAGALGAFYAVYNARNQATGFAGTFDALTKEDVGFGNFPWISVVFAFLVVFGVGVALMWIEADRPFRRLADDAVRLAQADKDRLDENLHRGKAGSVARSVNIAIDKMQRETKAARQDLDELLGPLPGEKSVPGAMPPSPLPPVGPGIQPQGSFAPPPPSEFRFSGDNTPRPVALPGAPPPKSAVMAVPTPIPSPVPSLRAGTQDITHNNEDALNDLELPPPPPNVVNKGSTHAATNTRVPPRPVAMPTGLANPTPVPTRPATRPPVAPIPAANGTLDDDILGGPDDVMSLPTDDERTVVSDASSRIASQDSDTVYFREVFEDFLALKRKCGEKTDNLTFERFAAKLRNNRDALMSKHRCRTVRFQVYVKDGKAALKASPVR